VINYETLPGRRLSGGNDTAAYMIDRLQSVKNGRAACSGNCHSVNRGCLVWVHRSHPPRRCVEYAPDAGPFLASTSSNAPDVRSAWQALWRFSSWSRLTASSVRASSKQSGSIRVELHAAALGTVTPRGPAGPGARPRGAASMCAGLPPAVATTCASGAAAGVVGVLAAGRLSRECAGLLSRGRQSRVAARAVLFDRLRYCA